MVPEVIRQLGPGAQQASAVPSSGSVVLRPDKWSQASLGQGIEKVCLAQVEAASDLVPHPHRRMSLSLHDERSV